MVGTWYHSKEAVEKARAEKQTTSARPTWDEVWMEVAYIVARRSVDPAYKIGCVIVSDDNQQVLSLGYNGMERGGPNVVDSTERGKSGTIHAEINALIKLNVDNPKRKRMYVTRSPCKMCARAIVNAGIHEVIFDKQYRDTSGINLLQERGVHVSHFPFKPG